MPTNTDPRYPKDGRSKFVRVTAASAKSDGSGTIGTDIFLAGTVGANGARLIGVNWSPTSSAASTATTATVGRVFISTQSSGATTNANTFPAGPNFEFNLPSVTAASPTVATAPYFQPIGTWVEANQSILVSTHAAPAANTAWVATAVWGDY